MKQPLLNQHTLAALKRFASQPSHALLLQGDPAAGQYTAAKYIQKLLQNNGQPAELFYVVEPTDKSNITIEQVRELRSLFKHKTANSNDTIQTIIVIKSIEDMQGEAQNALLKHLEEPPVGVLFIILCHDLSRMLQTITSRCVVVTVLPVTIQTAASYFSMPTADLTKYYAISGGSAELLVQLVTSTDHPLLADINDAKTVLTSTIYARLCMVDKQYKSTEQALKLIAGLQKICRAGLKSGTKTSVWLHNNIALQQASKKLHARVQAKLVIDELFITLK